MVEFSFSFCQNKVHLAPASRVSSFFTQYFTLKINDYVILRQMLRFCYSANLWCRSLIVINGRNDGMYWWQLTHSFLPRFGYIVTCYRSAYDEMLRANLMRSGKLTTLLWRNFMQICVDTWHTFLSSMFVSWGYMVLRTMELSVTFVKCACHCEVKPKRVCCSHWA